MGTFFSNGTIWCGFQKYATSVRIENGLIDGITKYTYATGGVITIPNGGQWMDGDGMGNVDNDNNPITS